MSSNVCKPGNIVWVKLSNSWWPGEVWDLNKVPDDLSLLKRKPIGAVKFFNEDSYEYVKNVTSIYEYNCHRKNEFIKKGLERSSGNLVTEKFRNDIVTAEKLTGGDINILENNALDKQSLASRRSNIVKMIFGDASSSNQKKKQQQKNNQKEIAIEKSPKLFSTLRGRSIITVKNIIKPFSPTNVNNSSQQHVSASVCSSSPSTPPNGIYKCHLCSFTSMRQNVIILHSKSHLNQSGSSLSSNSITPSRLSGNNSFSIPRGKNSVIVIDDDEDDSDLSRAQTPQTVVATIDISSDSQIIDVSLSPPESSSSSSSGDKTLPAQKILPATVDSNSIVDKKKKGRGNKAGNKFTISTSPLQSSDSIETAVCHEATTPKEDYIPLIKPPKKQIRKEILKDILEDWGDDDSTSHNTKDYTNKPLDNQDLGCSRLDVSDVEVLKNLQYADRAYKNKSPPTTKTVRNIPKKDRQRNMVLEDYSDSSSNITPNINVIFENPEILAVNASANEERKNNNNAIIVSCEKLAPANTTNFEHVQHLIEATSNKEQDLSDLHNSKTDTSSENIDVQIAEKCTLEEQSLKDKAEVIKRTELTAENLSDEDLNSDKNESINSLILETNIPNNLIGQPLEKANEDINENTSLISTRSNDLLNSSIIYEKSCESDQIESPEFEVIDAGKLTVITKTSDGVKFDETFDLTEKEVENSIKEPNVSITNSKINLLTENEKNQDDNEVEQEKVIELSSEKNLIYEKGEAEITVEPTEEITEEINQIKPISNEQKAEEHSVTSEKDVEKEIEGLMNETTTTVAETNNETEISVEQTKNEAQDVCINNPIDPNSEEFFEEPSIAQEIVNHDVNENTPDENNIEMLKPFGRSRRSIAQLNKSVNQKIRKSSRKSDNIYKILGREITTPSPVISSESPVSEQLDTSSTSTAEETDRIFSVKLIETSSTELPKITIQLNNAEHFRNKEKNSSWTKELKKFAEENIEADEKSVGETKTSHKLLKKQKIETVEKKASTDSEKFIEFLENEIKATPDKTLVSEEDKNIISVIEKELMTDDLEHLSVQEKHTGRTLRERKVKKEYAELDEDSLSAEVKNKCPLDNGSSSKKESKIESLIKSKKPSSKHVKIPKASCPEQKTVDVIENREVIPKLIIKSSKELGKEVTLKVMTVPPQKMISEITSHDEQISSDNELKKLNEQQSPRSPKKTAKKSYSKQKINEKKLFRKDSPEPQKPDKTHKEDASVAIFDFQEEDDTELVLTSLSKLKKKYMSPDKPKEVDLNPVIDTEKNIQIEKEDEKLKAEIENLLNDTKISDISVVKNTNKSMASTDISDNIQNSSLTDEVKTLPIKERGKRFFKSRNVSRNEDSQHSSLANTATSSEKTYISEVVNFEKSASKVSQTEESKETNSIDTFKETKQNCHKSIDPVLLNTSLEPIVNTEILEKTPLESAEIQPIEPLNNVLKSETKLLLNTSLIIEENISDREKVNTFESGNCSSVITDTQNESSLSQIKDKAKETEENKNEDVSSNLEIETKNTKNPDGEVTNELNSQVTSNIILISPNQNISSQYNSSLLEGEIELNNSIANPEKSNTDDNKQLVLQSEQKILQNYFNTIHGNSITRRRRSHLKVTPRKRNIIEESTKTEFVEKSSEECLSKVPKLEEAMISNKDDDRKDCVISLLLNNKNQHQTKITNSEINVKEIEIVAVDEIQTATEIEKTFELNSSNEHNNKQLDKDFKNEVSKEIANIVLQGSKSAESETIKNTQCESIIDKNSSAEDNSLELKTKHKNIIEDCKNNHETANLFSSNIIEETTNMQNKSDKNLEDFSIEALRQLKAPSTEASSKERKREKSITEQYEENFVERYMKDSGILNLSPQSKSKTQNSSEIEKIPCELAQVEVHTDIPCEPVQVEVHKDIPFEPVQVEVHTDISCEPVQVHKDIEYEVEAVADSIVTIVQKSLDEIIEETKEIEEAEILGNTQHDVSLSNASELPLIEQARAIVSKVNTTQSLSDIRSFRPKRKINVCKISENSTTEISPQSSRSTNESIPICSVPHSTMEEKLSESETPNKLEEILSITTISSSIKCETNDHLHSKPLPTCSDFKILEAAGKLVEVQQNTSAEELVGSKTSISPIKGTITVDSEHPLSTQIANILAAGSDFEAITDNDTSTKETTNNTKKRKLSLEEDIPTFIIDKTASNTNTAPLNESFKEKPTKLQIENIKNNNNTENMNKILIPAQNNLLEEKEKLVSHQELFSNMKEIVRSENPSKCIQKQETKQSVDKSLDTSNTIATVTETVTAVTENVYDISTLPILLTNEEIMQDNIQFVITQQPVLQQEDQQHPTTQSVLSAANVLQQTVVEQVVVQTAKKIRGRPRRSDPSLPQITSSISTGYSQTSTNNTSTMKLATQSVSTNQQCTISNPNVNQKGLIKKPQQNITSASPQITTIESSNQTYNAKPTCSRELGIDASGNSIVLIQYGRTNQKLMKMSKTTTDQLEVTPILDNKMAPSKEPTTKKVETPQLQNPLQTQCIGHHGSGQTIPNRGTNPTENITQSANVPQQINSFRNIGSKPTNINEVVITPIYETGTVSQKPSQQQLPQIPQTSTSQNITNKNPQVQRTTYVGGESSEIVIRQIQQQQQEQQQQKHSNTLIQRGRKRKEPECTITPQNQNLSNPQRNKQQKLYQPNQLSYNNTKSPILTQNELTTSAIPNPPPQNQQQSSVQQQQQQLQQQQQQEQLIQQRQQLQQQQKQTIIEEEIAANKIMAVPANHFGIPGAAYYLCSQDNEGNYMPIDNQELYLNPESNQLVPLSVFNSKTTVDASEQNTSGLLDDNQQLNLIEANSAEATCISMEINDANKQQNENTSNGSGVTACADNVEIGQQFIPTTNLTAAELSSILSPDQSICINIDGQQLILDQQSFLALVAAGGENTQLETQDGQILQLTSEFLAALGIGVSNQVDVSNDDGSGVNGGDENSSGEQQILLHTTNEEIVTNTDILASALIDDVLEIETTQGVQLVNAVSGGVVSEETLGSAFQALTPPVTAQTSETNALLTQPPIMSTLEVPSNKKKHQTKQHDNRTILLNALNDATGNANNGINNINNRINNSRNVGGSSVNLNNSSERILTTPQNLEDCIAFIGVSTQSSTVPASLELPITVTNPAIAPPKTTAPLGGLFNTKNLMVESSQISPQLVSSISSDPELQLELFTTSSTSSSSIGNNNHNNIINKVNSNNDENVGDNVVACNIEIEKFTDNSKQDVECVESGLNDFTNQSTIGNLSFEDPNR